MQYRIEGTPLPVAICQLAPGETMITERGSMSWMTNNIHMETTTNGGIGKAIGRIFSGESFFLNRFTAMNGPAEIAFASSFPGSIYAINIQPGRSIIVQKSAFLACEQTVELSVFFQKKIGAGLVGGEGFIMQRLSGQGTAFIEIDGYAMEYVLAPGQQMIIDTGYLAMMDDTVQMDIQSVKGVKNALFGGEGFFNTVVTGPGRILLQTMPVPKVASLISPYIYTGK